MRINFDSSFRDIQKLISVSTKAATSKEEFEKTLASVSPDAPKTQEIQAIPPRSEFAQGEVDGSPRASFNFNSPALLMPETEPANVPEPPLEAVKPAAPGVKTPTLLEARRIHVKDPFANLSLSERMSTVKKMVSEAGLKHGIDPLLGMAVVSAESSFNAVAISNDGHASKGLMQLLDGTGQRFMDKNNIDSAYQPYDPKLNVDLGVSYLRHLHDLFVKESELPNNQKTSAAENSSSLEKLAVAAYNAGESRVASAQERAAKAGKNPGSYEAIEAYLPDTTQVYVKRVLSAKQQLEGSQFGKSEEKL